MKRITNWILALFFVCLLSAGASAAPVKLHKAAGSSPLSVIKLVAERVGQPIKVFEDDNVRLGLKLGKRIALVVKFR